ncbi:endo alpha-1,4 polygalactosaminidase [Actinomycetes bacterium M1A6_2h]
MKSTALLVCALLGVAAAACGDETTGFPTGGRIDYQLGGAYEPAQPLALVTRDSTSTPLPGTYSICYVNGFQTQPGDDARWDRDLLLRDESGKPVIDPNWPDEFLLDPSTPDKRNRIGEVIGGVIDGCKKSGFDAVEIDNLDTYTRFPVIERQATIELARWYAERAHRAGLLIGQKNSAEDAADLKESVGFDFATSEECVYFDECSSYTEVYGERVVDVEYTDAMRGGVDDVCNSPDRIAMTVVRDRNLVSPGNPYYSYRAC